jgi:hypothetical protein
VPDGYSRRQPFKMSDWQFWVTANHYRIRDDAKFDPADPPRNQAFFYRRSQVVAPQKTGKGPWSASITCVEAVGPSQFIGWAGPDDVYRCADNGCPLRLGVRVHRGRADGCAAPVAADPADGDV